MRKQPYSSSANTETKKNRTETYTTENMIAKGGQKSTHMYCTQQNKIIFISEHLHLCF